MKYIINDFGTYEIEANSYEEAVTIYTEYLAKKMSEYDKSDCITI